MYDWHMDLTPPRNGDVETRLSFSVAMRKLGREFDKAGFIISPAIAKALGSIGLLSDAFIVPKPTKTSSSLRVSDEPKKPFKYDKPTNVFYPTSFDSWINEYDQPLRGPQVQKTRRPYRR